VVSEELAAQNHAGIGTWITLDAQTPQGYVNSIEFMVTGLYKNAAPWDNKLVYISDKNARELFQWDGSLFAQARVFLKEPERASAWARDLDRYLLAQSDELRAEPAGQSGEFFLTFGRTIKSVFFAFTVFLYSVIGLGIRSTVRLSVFERLGEFGTLRAVGFARPSAFLIVFFEVLVLGIFALAAAALCTLVLTAVLGATGLFVGNGVLNSLLGGEYVYPAADPLDFLAALGLIGLCSLFSPLKPALRVTFQKITDLLARNQKQLFATVEIVRTAVHSILRRRTADATVHERSHQ
jgi:putative ABC transport system permease protein